MAISDIIAPAAMNERPKTPPPAAVKEKGANSESWKIVSPNSAITTSGVPAMISMLDSTTRASRAGRPYSTIHSAQPIASGVASSRPISVRISVPNSGSRKPPLPAWERLTWGRLKIRLGAQVLRPAVGHVATIAAAIRQGRARLPRRGRVSAGRASAIHGGWSACRDAAQGLRGRVGA